MVESRAKSWFEEEETEKGDKTITFKVIAAFWRVRVLEGKIDATGKLDRSRIDSFKSFIENKYPESKKEIDSDFDAAITTKDFNKFKNLLEKIITPSDAIMIDKAQGFGIIPEPADVEVKKITDSQLLELEKYLVDKKISASISIGNTALNEFKLINSPGIISDSFFSIHSVTKIFTRALVLRMVEEKIFSAPKDLDQPLCDVRKDFVDSLPDKFKDYLTAHKITLHQLLIHTSGIGDYLVNENGYINAIATSLESKESKPPEIKSIKDFLQFADVEKPEMINSRRYSNVAITLVGLAIEHAYKKAHPEVIPQLNFYEILAKYVLKEAGIEASHFSKCMPQDDSARYDKADITATHIVASPAAGFWTTTRDLEKFDQWLYKKCQDQNFKNLLKVFGKEVHDQQKDIIEHTGFVVSSSAAFYLSLKTGNSISILSDQKDSAVELLLAVKKHLFSKPQAIKSSSLGSTAKMGITVGLPSLKDLKSEVKKAKTVIHEILPSAREPIINPTVSSPSSYETPKPKPAGPKTKI